MCDCNCINDFKECSLCLFYDSDMCWCVLTECFINLNLNNNE